MNDKQAIETLITKTYRDALANCDIDATMNRVFSKNPVVCPPAAATCEGFEAVKANYEGIFKSVKLDLQFHIHEITVDGDHAYVRSNSDGTVEILTNGDKLPELNRELFVIVKEDDEWRIAVYMYNKES